MKLVPRSSPLTLNRVPSVFVANQLNQFDKSKREMEAELEKGAETEEDMEVDDHDTSINVVEMPFSETLLVRELTLIHVPVFGLHCVSTIMTCTKQG